MAKEPRTASEHIIALYGHIKGLKREVFNIKQNHLKHIHSDIDKLHDKILKLERQINRVESILLVSVGALISGMAYLIFTLVSQ